MGPPGPGENRHSLLYSGIADKEKENSIMQREESLVIRDVSVGKGSTSWRRVNND